MTDGAIEVFGANDKLVLLLGMAVAIALAGVVAELASEVNLNTWRMWRARLPLGRGLHTAEVRATDKTGATQTPERVDPINPAHEDTTGWHAIRFTVT